MKATTFTISITFLLSLILYNCQQEKLTDFQEQQTILRGKILNYRDSVIIFTHPGDPATNYLKGEKYAVNLNSDGSFEWRITLNKPLEVNFSNGSYSNDIYLEPGYSSFIEFNANSSNRKITFTGDGNLENNCNQNIRNLSLEKSTVASATSNKLSFQQMKQIKEEEAKQRLIVLKERNKNKHLSDHFFRWKQAEITYEALADLYFPTKEFKIPYSKAVNLSIHQLDDDFAALYSHNYNSVVGFYSMEEFVRLLKANKKPGHNYDHANEIFKGQTKEASLAKTVLFLINYKFDSLAKLYHEKAQTDIKNPNMLAHVNVAFGQYEQAKRKPYKITKETIASNYSFSKSNYESIQG